MPLQPEHAPSSFGFPRLRIAPPALGALLIVLVAVWGGSAAVADQAAGKPKAAGDSAAEVVARVNGKPILRRDFDLSVQIQFRGRRPANVGF